MNKYKRWLILLLLDMRLHKMERAALKKFQGKRRILGNKIVLRDYVEDWHEYRRLADLRINIETINSPWQGTFLPWVLPFAAKDSKYVKEFPPMPEPEEEKPLTPGDAYWAEMPNEEFFEAVASLEGKFENKFETYPAGEPRDLSEQKR